MREQTTRKQNVARVFQPKRALGEYEGGFERRAVESLIVKSRLAFAAGIEGESRFADVSLSPLVRTNPVIVEDCETDDYEQPQRRKRSAARQKRDGERRKRGRRHDAKCAPNAASRIFRGPFGARFQAFRVAREYPPPATPGAPAGRRRRSPASCARPCGLRARSRTPRCSRRRAGTSSSPRPCRTQACRGRPCRGTGRSAS